MVPLGFGFHALSCKFVDRFNFALSLILATAATSVSADLIVSTEDFVNGCSVMDNEPCGDIGDGEWGLTLCCMHSDHACLDDQASGIKLCLPVSSTRDPVD